MWKIVRKVNKNLIITISLFLFGGFIFGISVDPAMGQLKSLIVALTVLMVFPMMITLNIGNLKKGLNYKLQATTQLINSTIDKPIWFGLSGERQTIGSITAPFNQNVGSVTRIIA